MSTDEMIAELKRRGVLIHVGYTYPAMASDKTATELIDEHGYEYGPWQLLELGHRLAQPPQWPLLAVVPETYRKADA
jgi:hypothetical protein